MSIAALVAEMMAPGLAPGGVVTTPRPTPNVGLQPACEAYHEGHLACQRPTVSVGVPADMPLP